MSKKNYKLYKSLFVRHGFSARAVKARTYIQQELRFKYLFECASIQSNDSILDVGCGFGDFFNFIKKKNLKCQYTGIDFVDDFIKCANKKYYKDKNAEFVKLKMNPPKILKQFYTF